MLSVLQGNVVDNTGCSDQQFVNLISLQNINETEIVSDWVSVADYSKLGIFIYALFGDNDSMMFKIEFTDDVQSVAYRQVEHALASSSGVLAVESFVYRIFDLTNATYKLVLSIKNKGARYMRITAYGDLLFTTIDRVKVDILRGHS